MLVFLSACAAPPDAPVDPAAPAATLDAPVAATVDPAPAIVLAARRYVGRPYRFGGRGEALDCMGLVIRAWADASGGSWRRLSVNPTELIARRQLGAPVPGLDGVRHVDLAPLRSGDVLFFLAADVNPAEPALVTIDGVPEWVWHMGLYSGDGAFLSADPFRGRVAEAPLLPWLRAAHGWIDALYVTRP